MRPISLILAALLLIGEALAQPPVGSVKSASWSDEKCEDALRILNIAISARHTHMGPKDAL